MLDSYYVRPCSVQIMMSNLGRLNPGNVNKKVETKYPYVLVNDHDFWFHVFGLVET